MWAEGDPIASVVLAQAHPNKLAKLLIHTSHINYSGSVGYGDIIIYICASSILYTC